jgi:5-methyltetrahydropteroyltriglutamate--homocysteine methyltransferase
MKALLTHEIGSLAKPGWRVKAYAGRPVPPEDVNDARRWGEQLGVEGHEDLLALLREAPLPRERRAEVARWSSVYGVRFLEAAGLDAVYDGEQQRSEMYNWAVTHATGFDARGSVRSFDNKYYTKAAVTGPVTLAEPYHDAEFLLLREMARAELKVPVTGAYTIGAWSFDEYHHCEDDLRLPAAIRREHRQQGRRSLVLELATRLIRPNLESLINLGARWLQVDEPGASTEPDELDLFVESFNASVDGLNAVFSTHLCFSDYELFFPAIEAMSGCQQYCVGFANDDARDLGVSESARPGYQIIKRFRDLPYRPALGVGVLDIHTDFIEPPELVRDRILYAVEVFGDPARIHVTPDCGLRTRTWEVAFGKLRNMVEGTRLAESALGLPT